MIQLKCASGLIDLFIYFETLVKINLLNTVACGPSLVYMLQFLLNNFKLMANNLQKRNKLDDSALFRTQSFSGITEICYFKFLSDGSCLCEACIFMKHITCVNLFMKHIICVSLQYVYMQLPVVYSI